MKKAEIRSDGIFQLFEDHDTLHRRLGKSLYYGGSESTSVDSLSFPLTQICVDHFNSVITESASNEQDIAGQKLFIIACRRS